MQLIGTFSTLVGLDRHPGPTNLLAPISEYLEVRGSAKRNEITKYLEDAWRAAGGDPLSGMEWGSEPERKAWEHRVKRALLVLEQQGKVRRAQVDGTRLLGVWEWIAPAREVPKARQSDEAEVSVGDGRYLVYALYDKHQKEAAVARGESRWPVKVGRTNGRSPFSRIQDGAFLPDKLVWGAAIWTDDPRNVEKLMHAALAARERRYQGNGGREFFVTNPAEIVDVYRAIFGSA